jgi:hypothetical protein
VHDLYAPEPPILLRLRGSQAQMGAQHGRLLLDIGGYEHTLAFYPRMASAMLSLAIPHPVRGPARALLQAGLPLGASGSIEPAAASFRSTRPGPTRCSKPAAFSSTPRCGRVTC